MRKFLSILMAIVLTLGISATAIACGGGEEEVEVDQTKTQLYLSNNDQGVGRTYLEAIGAMFEEDFKNYSFEEGKVGVQVIYNHNTRINSASFYETMENDLDYIYFTEYVDYVQYGKKFADVTKLLNEGAITGVDESGNLVREEKTIESKLRDNVREFLDRNSSADAEEYRAVPHYIALKNFNYDKDLWNEKSLYFSKGGCPSEDVVTVLSKGEGNYTDAELNTAISSYNTKITKGHTDSTVWTFVNEKGEATVGGTTVEIGLSAGPNGKYGDFDDGLPATYDEFYVLMDKMVASNVTPIIWSGGNPGYAEMVTTSLFQNDMGVDNLNAYYSLNGTIDNLVEFNGEKMVKNADGTPKISDPYTFNGGKKDGFEAQRTVSKYYALEFVRKLGTTSSWTNGACYRVATSQIMAQGLFLTEGNTADGKRNAMLIDGSWWQQEATSTFESMAKDDAKYSKANRNFGMLPLPNSTISRFVEKVQNNEKNVIVSGNDAFCFINGNLEAPGKETELNISRIFLSYFNSNKAALKFTETTDMIRAIDVDYTGVESSLNNYGRNLVQYAKLCDVLYPYCNNEFVKQNQLVFENTSDAWNWHAYGDEPLGEKSQTVQTFHSNPSITASDYFEGLYRYYKTKVKIWEN